MKIHLIVTGKLKDKNLEAIEENYLKRISESFCIHEVKSFSEDKENEAKAVLKKIDELSKNAAPYIITLLEDGQHFSSPSFSKWLYLKIESHKNIIFIIAGAMGHGKSVLNLSSESLSLSPLTFPHKIARILFTEQLYRAITIQKNHPYHN